MPGTDDLTLMDIQAGDDATVEMDSPMTQDSPGTYINILIWFFRAAAVYFSFILSVRFQDRRGRLGPGAGNRD